MVIQPAPRWGRFRWRGWRRGRSLPVTTMRECLRILAAGLIRVSVSVHCHPLFVGWAACHDVYGCLVLVQIAELAGRAESCPVAGVVASHSETSKSGGDHFGVQLPPFFPTTSSLDCLIDVAVGRGPTCLWGVAGWMKVCTRAFPSGGSGGVLPECRASVTLAGRLWAQPPVSSTSSLGCLRSVAVGRGPACLGNVAGWM